MKRLLALTLLLIFSAWEDARGQAGPPVKSSPLVLDVRDYGDDLQAAIDAINGPHAVRLPGRAQTYNPSGEPVWLDKDFVTLEGDRGLSTVTGSILAGLWRVPLGPDTGKPQNLADPARPYAFDARPLLDGSLGGPWTGLRLYGDSFLVGAATGLALGPKGGWEAVETLCIEWAEQVDPSYPNGAVLGLFGDAQSSTNPAPFYVRHQDASVDSDWVTGDGKQHGIRFPGPKPDAKGVVRFALQITPATGKALAWANRVQVAANPTGAPTTPGSTFGPNVLAHFAVGGAGMLELASSSTQNVLDLRILGMRISTKAVYADDGVGKAQRRLDGKPISDNGTYASWVDGILDMLRLDLPAADMTARRRVWTWPSTHYVLWLSTGHGNVNTGPVQGNRLSGLTVKTLNNYHGAAVLAGLPLHLTVSDCTLTGGGAGFWGIAASANYKYLFRDTTFEAMNASGAGGAGLSLYYAIAKGENLRIKGYGRYDVLASMCDLDIDGLFLEGLSPDCIYAVCSPRNTEFSRYVVRNVSGDYENNGPSKGAFLFAAGNLAPGVWAKLEGVAWGNIAPDAAFVELRGYVGAPGYWHDSTFIGEGLGYRTSGGQPMVRVIGPPGKASRWVGRISGYPENQKGADYPDGMPGTIGTQGFGAQQAPAPQPAPEPPPQGRKARFELLRRAAR